MKSRQLVSYCLAKLRVLLWKIQNKVRKGFAQNFISYKILLVHYRKLKVPSMINPCNLEVQTTEEPLVGNYPMPSLFSRLLFDLNVIQLLSFKLARFSQFFCSKKKSKKSQKAKNWALSLNYKSSSVIS